MLWQLFGFVMFLVACGVEGDALAGTKWRLIALGDADAPAEAAAGGDSCRSRIDVRDRWVNQAQRDGAAVTADPAAHPISA